MLFSNISTVSYSIERLLKFPEKAVWLVPGLVDGLSLDLDKELGRNKRTLVFFWKNLMPRLGKIMEQLEVFTLVISVKSTTGQQRT